MLWQLAHYRKLPKELLLIAYTLQPKSYIRAQTPCELTKHYKVSLIKMIVFPSIVRHIYIHSQAAFWLTHDLKLGTNIYHWQPDLKIHCTVG